MEAPCVFRRRDLRNDVTWCIHFLTLRRNP